MIHRRIDDRELLREMANQIEASAFGCLDIGATERGQSMLKWATRLRVEAECVDEDGEPIYQQGHA